MKIEERDGKKFVVFESADAELKAAFQSTLQEEVALRDATVRLSEEHDVICRRLKMAVKRLELFRDENRDRLWKPIEEAVKALLGVEEVHLTCRTTTGEIVLEEDKEDPTAPPMMRFLHEALRMLTQPREDDEKKDQDGKPDDDLLH